MNVQAIRDLINRARELEAENGHLRKQICEQMEQLHHTIELPEDDPCNTLLLFVNDYINHVPEFMDALCIASKEAGISDFIFPFLDIAEENFLSPVNQSEPLTGLDVLLDKAYFAHRLIEEVNDQYLTKAGSTLIPMNMIWANLIVHSILGEPFSIELDDIVEQTAQQMMRSHSIYNEERYREFIEQRCPEQWVETWSRWSCLSNDLGIELKFTSAA